MISSVTSDGALNVWSCSTEEAHSLTKLPLKWDSHGPLSIARQCRVQTKTNFHISHRSYSTSFDLHVWKRHCGYGCRSRSVQIAVINYQMLTFRFGIIQACFSTKTYIDTLPLHIEILKVFRCLIIAVNILPKILVVL